MITRHATSRTLVIRPSENLDALASEHYRSQLRTLINEGYRFLIFDFEETKYINSSGLGLLVEFNNLVRNQGGTVKLVNCNREIVALLAQTRLDAIFLGTESGGETTASETPPEPVRFDVLHEAMSNELCLMTHMQQIIGRMLEDNSPAHIGRILLAGTLEALKTDRGALFFIDEDVRHITLAELRRGLGQTDAAQLVRLPLREGRLEHCMIHGAQVQRHQIGANRDVDDSLFAELGFTSILSAAIVTDNRPLALLAAEVGSGMMQTAASATPMIVSFGYVAGLALENAALLERLQDQKRALKTACEKLTHNQKTLIEAGRLSALGSAIGGVGAMIEARLIPLAERAARLAGESGPPETAAQRVAEMNEAGEQLRSFSSKLNALAHSGGGREAIGLNALVETALELLAEQIGRHGIEVRRRLADDLGLLTGDYSLLLQAVMAVLHRASSAFEKGAAERWIEIETEQTGPVIRLSVEDNGGALPASDDEELLDPLLPEKDLKAGRIFNFAIPREIVSSLGGRFSLAARPSGGACVVIEFDSALPAGGENAGTGRDEI